MPIVGSSYHALFINLLFFLYVCVCVTMCGIFMYVCMYIHMCVDVCVRTRTLICTHVWSSELGILYFPQLFNLFSLLQQAAQPVISRDPPISGPLPSAEG